MFRAPRLLNFAKFNKTFHTKVFPIADRNNQTQGVIFQITGNGESLTKNKNILYRELFNTGLMPTQHYAVFHVLQTLRNYLGKIVADPHLLGGIFLPDLTILQGTGISKVHGRVADKTAEDYKAVAHFHSDKAVQNSIFSPQDGGISDFGCARYILVLNIGITNIDISKLIKDIEDEKKRNLYDRKFDNCTHSVTRVFTGNTSMDPFPVDTQFALVEIAKQITKSVDSVFSDNFCDAARLSQLIQYSHKMTVRLSS